MKEKKPSKLFACFFITSLYIFSVTAGNISSQSQTSVAEVENGTLIETLDVQQTGKTITGTVTDENGESIIGANIIEVGTSNGTVTDVDGNFSLKVANDASIQITYIG